VPPRDSASSRPAARSPFTGLPLWIAALVARPELVQLDRHQLVGEFGRCREHLDLRFVAVADDHATHAVSEESFAVRWWPTDELPEDSRRDLEPLVALARSVLGLG